jgi:2,4-dienoyl-CoA reductase-like NADH-dependent reductase (Old Yellow Enzyme family)
MSNAPTETSAELAPLFRPFTLKNLTLANRIVMAPMTRGKSPGGAPDAKVAAYYRKRTEGGVALLITEGTFIPHPAAGYDANVPRFYGDDALAGWKNVVHAVHTAGGRIMPQLWHVGAQRQPNEAYPAEPVSPSGLRGPGQPNGRAMTQQDIDDVIHAFGVAAKSAREFGFDGVELHGAHGYLIDQFLWEGTNQRTDEYGGSLEKRTRFAVEVVKEVRRQLGAELPLILRLSQWKLTDYNARIAQTPEELTRILQPLVEAGVDCFHCSQRRFWDPEFPNSSSPESALNFAGWTKKLTGKPTITVGSVTLNEEFMTTFRSDEGAGVTGLGELLDRLSKEEFDLVAIGRALIVNPDWPKLVMAGKMDQLKPFQKQALETLA